MSSCLQCIEVFMHRALRADLGAFKTKRETSRQAAAVPIGRGEPRMALKARRALFFFHPFLSACGRLICQLKAGRAITAREARSIYAALIALKDWARFSCALRVYLLWAFLFPAFFPRLLLLRPANCSLMQLAVCSCLGLEFDE